jgi:acetyl esterase/lipase
MGWFIDHYLSGGAGHRPTRACRRTSPPTTCSPPLPRARDHRRVRPAARRGRRVRGRLAALGVPTSHVRFGGMFHGFFSLADFVDDGAAANALAAAAVKKALDRGDRPFG